MTAENGPAFWSSKDAELYPDFVTIDGARHTLGAGSNERIRIGALLRQNRFVPVNGEILDLGSGPCSGLIFGPEEAAQRVTAVDISSALLARNIARQNITMDLRSPDFPPDWEGKFSLASAIFLWRYLELKERFFLMLEARRLLTKGGRIIIMDFPYNEDTKMAQLLGEVYPFDDKLEKRLLKTLGFKEVELKIVVYEWGFEGKKKALGFSYVTAVNPGNSSMLELLKISQSL